MLPLASLAVEATAALKEQQQHGMLFA